MSHGFYFNSVNLFKNISYLNKLIGITADVVNDGRDIQFSTNTNDSTSLLNLVSNTKTADTGDIVISTLGSKLPDFLLCNGAYISQTDYSNLYSVIGNSYDLPDTSLGFGKPWKQQYNINTTNTVTDITGWVSSGSLPISLNVAQAVVTTNRVFLIGGRTNSYLTSVYTAPVNSDGTIGAWGLTSPLPSPVGWSQAVVIANKIYLIGGYNGTPVSSVYTATINSDGTLNTWTIDNPLPGPIASSQVIVTSSRVYVLGGWINSASSIVYTATINADGTLGSWSTGPSLPIALSNAQTIVTSNRVYLVGGYTTTWSSLVYTASINPDGTLGSWTLGPSIPGPLTYSQAVVTSSRVYLLGGRSNAGYISTVYTAPINADGTLGIWTIGTSLPAAFGRGQVFVTSSRIYLLGSITTSTIYSAPFTGGLNDYRPQPNTTTGLFRLPDYSNLLTSDLNFYIKT